MLKFIYLLLFSILSSICFSQSTNTSYLLPCNSTDDCSTGSCLLFNDDGLSDTCTTTNSTNECFCLNTGDKCTSSGICYTGSSCLQFTPNATGGFCVPCASLSNMDPPPQQIDALDICNGVPYSNPDPPGEMLTSCTGDVECGYGECAGFGNDGTKWNCVSSLTSDCFCYADLKCSTADGCFVNSDCAQITNNSLNYCIPCSSFNNRFPRPFTNDTSICDVQHSYAPLTTGGVLQSCEEDDNCEESLFCKAIGNNHGIFDCRVDADCFCVNNSTCTDSGSCPENSGCARISSSFDSFCIPCDAAELITPLPVFIDGDHLCDGIIETEEPTIPSFPPSVSPEVPLIPTSTPIFDNTSLLLPCNATNTCISGSCVQINSTGFPSTCNTSSNSSNSGDCLCLNVRPSPRNICSSSASCLLGSSCVTLTPNATFGYCVPCASLSNLDPPPQQIDDDDVCSLTSYSNPDPPGDMLTSCTRDGDCDYGGCSTLDNNGGWWTCAFTWTSDCFCLAGFGLNCTTADLCYVNSDCVKVNTNSPSFCIPCSSFNNRFPPPISNNGSICDVQYSYAPLTTGGALQSCEEDDNCEDSLFCKAIGNNHGIFDCRVDADCFCINNSTCSESRFCPENHGCASISNSKEGFCIPCDSFENVVPPPEFVDDNACILIESPSLNETVVPVPTALLSETPSPTALPSVTNTTEDNQGLTLESCTLFNPSFCKEPRTCADGDSLLNGDFVRCSTPSTICVCSPQIFTSCTSSSGCEDGERCVETEGILACISCNAFKPPLVNITNMDDGLGKCSSSAPCIAVDSLQHLHESQLVYQNHIRAAVLCDNLNNCATPGHMVVHNGTPMMMKNYCNVVVDGCRKTVKMVNNPKMRRGLRIQSKSNELEFTAFSARYETSWEEGVIGMVVRSGL